MDSELSNLIWPDECWLQIVYDAGLYTVLNMLGEILFNSLIGLLCLVIAPVLVVALLPCVWMYRRCTRSWGFAKGRTQKSAVYDVNSECFVRLVDAKVPLLTSNHVLVKIKAAAVNPVDAKIVVGDKFPEKYIPFWAKYVLGGMSVGFDFAGVVIDSPRGCEFKPGAEVFGLNYHYAPRGMGKFGGSICEIAKVPLDQVWRKPRSLSFVEACALPLVGTTVLQSFEQHNIGKSKRILVIGASGGVGHLATQIGSRIKASVVGVCSTKNVHKVKKYGAEDVIDYRSKDVSLDDALRKHQAKKFDVVIDTVSSADSRDRKAAYPNRISKLCVLKRHDEEPGVDPHNYVVFGGETWSWWRALILRLIGFNFFPLGFELFWIRMPKSRRYLQTLQSMCDNLDLRPEIMKVFPFTDEGVRAAFRIVHPPPGKTRSASGKVVIRIDGDVKK